MVKRNKTLQWRNKQIYAEYLAHLRNHVPVMDIYAILARNYDIDSDYIRQIIRKQAKVH